MRIPHVARMIAAALLPMCMSVGAQALETPPKVTSVTFTYSHGTVGARIVGQNFGNVPAGIPCVHCAPSELQTVLIASQPVRQTVNVTSWNDNAITVSGIVAAKGSAIRFGIYNGKTRLAGAWGGVTSHIPGLPDISSIRFSSPLPADRRNLTVTVTGTGFGTAPAAVGQAADTPFFLLTDFNRFASAPHGFPWNAGFCGGPDCDGVQVVYQSWSDTQIVISGFAGEYGADFQVYPRDAICIAVWPSTSASNGTTGARVRCTHLPPH